MAEGNRAWRVIQLQIAEIIHGFRMISPQMSKWAFEELSSGNDRQ